MWPNADDANFHLDPGARSLPGHGAFCYRPRRQPDGCQRGWCR